MQNQELLKPFIEETVNQLKEYPTLGELYKNCFPNTLETTTKRHDDGSTYIFTGDIPAMWLRDSAEQVRHYFPYLNRSKELQAIIRGLIDKHLFYINHDPYANSFNETANDHHWDPEDDADVSPWVWERKYEVDSLCFSIRLMYEYWQETGDGSILNDRFLRAADQVVTVWTKEQQHEDQSDYFFRRSDCPVHDTLPNHGKGRPVNLTGMTWNGFRPSDDACEFGYHIPANMFAAVTLGYLGEMVGRFPDEYHLSRKIKTLKEEIERGIETYGIIEHPTFGAIYCYETDGFGNHIVMDDAGTPSLLSIPYIGYRTKDDPVYQNTRAFALSSSNPYFFEGQYASGLGSPHTPDGYVWHLGLLMQALTAGHGDEFRSIMSVVEQTDAGTGFMHEGFDADDPQRFTREWFAWANSLFCLTIQKGLKEGYL